MPSPGEAAKGDFTVGTKLRETKLCCIPETDLELISYDITSPKSGHMKVRCLNMKLLPRLPTDLLALLEFYPP